MDTNALLIAGLAVILLVGGVIVWFLIMGGAGDGSSDQVGAILSAQRGIPNDPGARKAFFITPEAEMRSGEGQGSQTLERRLRYGQIHMTPTVYWIWVVSIGFVSFFIAARIFSLFLALFFLFTGQIVMGLFVSFRVDQRFKSFDRDYPQFLLALVGLLKTGMNTLTAIGAAAEGMDSGSLVRQEIELMLERLRFGVSEEKSIGSFGEDIAHPEIELFVQALLLNKRLGGNLSDTLERLSKQVRRRQYFRQAAVAAVGLQRGSLWFILVILFVIQLYLYIEMPVTVLDSLKDEYGWMGWQGALFVIMIGMLWLRQVTRIRV